MGLFSIPKNETKEELLKAVEGNIKLYKSHHTESSDYSYLLDIARGVLKQYEDLYGKYENNNFDILKV